MVAARRQQVAPGVKTGRGLKLVYLDQPAEPAAVAPGVKTGRGLKLSPRNGQKDDRLVAPGVKTGRGLKHLWARAAGRSRQSGARRQNRARIEIIMARAGRAIVLFCERYRGGYDESYTGRGFCKHFA